MINYYNCINVKYEIIGVTAVFFSYPLDLLRTRLAFEFHESTASASNIPDSSIIPTGPKIVRDTSKPVPTSKSIQLAAPLSSSTNANVGLLSTARNIYSETNQFGFGLANFYRGFMPTVYGMIPYAGVSFLSYETLKSWALASQRHYKNHNRPTQDTKLNWWLQMVIGGVSGGVAQTVSYPLEVIRRLMQVSGKDVSSNSSSTSSSSSNGYRGDIISSGTARFKSTLETASEVFQRRGARGFFVGLSIGYLKIIPMHAVSFYVYEYMKGLLAIS
jgi:solute carrier family 25 protein 16